MFDVESDLEWLKSLGDYITRGEAALETCPDTGREHLQGRITYKSAHRRPYMKKQNPKAHWEPTKLIHDWTYGHKKDSSLVWQVDNRRQGHRKDLEELKLAVEEGKGELECFESHFGTMVRYGRGVERYRSLLSAKQRKAHCETFVFWGSAGVGKSEYVAKRWPEAYELCPDEKGAIWWDGYDNQETVVLNDYRGDWMKYHCLLRLLDWHGKYRASFKGGSKWLTNVKTFVFTSCESPAAWYPYKYDSQLHRRLHNVYNVDKDDFP